MIDKGEVTAASPLLLGCVVRAVLAVVAYERMSDARRPPARRPPARLPQVASLVEGDSRVREVIFCSKFRSFGWKRPLVGESDDKLV